MNSLERINFHHLHYFWAVAHDGNLTRTAARLHVAQSALSAQIHQLEDALGEVLLARKGRGLVLTEAGVIALGYADDIFAAGHELASTLQRGPRADSTLSVGAVATLSRNFQESFVTPLLTEPDITLRLTSGSLDELLAALARHELDVVLSNRPARSEVGKTWHSRRIATQPVSLVGGKRRRNFRFPDDLRDALMILPGKDNELRGAFDALCEQHALSVRVLAEVDDMAMMRLLARDTGALALVPSVVVRDELRARVLHEYCVVPGLLETFYAVTVKRRFAHPLLRTLLSRTEDDLLAMRT